MSDFYEQGGKPRGKCSVCGTTETHAQKRNPKFLAPFYFSVFEKMDWFRGNDEYRGKICKNCLKAGRIEESKKVTPAPTKAKGDN